MVLAVKKNNNSMMEEEESVAGRRGLASPSPSSFPPGGLTSCHLPLPLKPFRYVVMNTGFSGAEGLCYLKTLQGLPRERRRIP